MESDFIDDSKGTYLLKDDDFACIVTDDVSIDCSLKLGANDRFASSAHDMAQWDHDDLLSSTALLPEMQPLLEMEGGQIPEDDFQRMLNDWESQIGSLQTHTTSEDELAMCSVTNQEDVFFGDDQVNNSSLHMDHSHPILSTTYSLQEQEQPRLTIGHKTLAGIVISSGPGGHFETYEGMRLQQEEGGTEQTPDLQHQRVPTDDFVLPSPPPSHSRDSVAVRHNPRSLLRRPPPPSSPCPAAVMDRPTDCMSTLLQDDALVDDRISVVNLGCGVIEASDVDNLLEQFEASEDCAGAALEDPKQRSHIIAAVNSHFSGSNKSFPPGKVPKIVSSQRIKESLPKEIVEKIKASSQKSKTIAIIEPIHRSPSSQSCSLGPIKSQGDMTSRFHEAGASIQRTKLRSIGIKQEMLQQQQQGGGQQVGLDHDYCSTAGKSNRQRQQQLTTTTTAAAAGTTTPSSTSPRTTGLSQRQATLTSTATSQTVIQVPSISHRNKNQVISLEKKSNMTQSPILVNIESPAPAVAAPPSLLVTQRRDSDLRKDSGLESDEVSDASNEEETAYSKIPPYLSSSSATKSSTEDHLYDRLPAYVTSTRSRNSPEKTVVVVIQPTVLAAATTTTVPNATTVFEPKSPISSPVVPKRDINTATAATGGGSKTRNLRRRRNSSSSSSSSLESSLTSSPPKKSVLPKEVKKSQKSRSSRGGRVSRSPSPSRRKSSTRQQRRRHSRKRRTSSSSSSSSSASPSPSPERRGRSRSPVRRRRSSRKRSYDRDRFTLERQRREQEQRHHKQEKQRQIEERKVIYVGQIAEGTTRADLRKRFEVFGPIEEISLHFRDRGDNYGFVGFRFKVDAYEALEHGNDDPSLPRVDICFGGRRTFCKEKYSDLDSIADPDQGGARNMDFDSLLKQARAGLRK